MVLEIQGRQGVCEGRWEDNLDDLSKRCISTRTMHQSTTPSLSQTNWPRWASRQFLSLLIVQTLLPVTFGYSLSSEAVVMRQLMRWRDRKWAGVWMTSFPEEMVQRVWGFWKDVSWDGTIDAWVGFWPLKDVVGFFGSLPTGRDELRY